MGIVSDHFLVGVDGGGTGCRIALCDPAGRRLAQASGGPANFTTDPKATLRNLTRALEEVAEKAALTPRDLERSVAHIGLAGVMNTADQAVIADALPFQHVTVSDDRNTSVTGALGERDGILAAIGTGTTVAARMDGALQCFGGWGHHLADHASGGWLGHKALRHALLAYDGLLEPSDLTKTVMQQFDDNPVKVVHFAATANPGDFATFGRVVIEAAQEGDRNARALMQRGAAYLESCFCAATLENNAIICLSGGVGPHYEPYLESSFRARLQQPHGTALDGALRLAQIARDRMEHGA